MLSAFTRAQASLAQASLAQASLRSVNRAVSFLTNLIERKFQLLINFRDPECNSQRLIKLCPIDPTGTLTVRKFSLG